MVVIPVIRVCDFINKANLLNVLKKLGKKVQEIISNDDDFINDTIVARGWNPMFSIYKIAHKDKDY